MANRLLDDIECKWWVRGRYGIGVCASAAELEGPLTQTTALAAARLLQRKHPLLRARIVGNVAPRFEDAGHAEPPVELRELDAVGDWRAIAERELHVPFDVERGPLWRAVIGTTRSDAHAVVFTFHHSIVDGRAQLRIVEQFVALCSLLVADPAADVAVVEPRPPVASLVDLIAPVGPPRPRRRPFPIAGRAPREQRTTRFLTRLLDAPTYATIQQRLKRELTTMHASLCTAALRATYELVGPDQELLILSPVDLRPFCSAPVGPQHIGCYASAMPIISNVADGNFWEQARAYHRELLGGIGEGRWRTYPTATPEHFAAEASTIERLSTDDELQGRTGDLIVSSGGDVPAQTGPIRIAAYYDPAGQHVMGHYFALYPHGVGSRCALTLAYATPVCSDDFATAFLDTLITTLSRNCGS